MWWTLEGNEKISGSILISHSVKFWITNPEDFIIQNYGILNQTTPFELQQQGGELHSSISERELV
jgi:hypothetical protein